MPEKAEDRKSRLIDGLWFIVLGLMLFGGGIAYQWYGQKNPVFPFTLFGNILDTSKGQLADAMEQAGLKEPHYFYQTDFDASDNQHDPAKAQAGLTLITGVTADRYLEAKIIELDGTPVQTWPIDWFTLWPDAEHLPEIFTPKQQPGTSIHGAVIADNGDLIFNFEYQGLMRIDVCGDVVWRLPYITHHSAHLDEDTGNLWVSGRIHHREFAPQFPNHQPPFDEPTVLEVSMDGEILTEISVLEILQVNDLDGLMHMDDFDDIQRGHGRTTGDTLHLNDIETFPKRLAPGVFKPGDVMMSLRNIHTVLVFDPKTMEIVYKQVGRFVGQHDPDFIDGKTISVFDNDVGIGEEADRDSRIILLSADDPFEEPEVVLEGQETWPFYTDVMGKHQWLANGNLLVTESTRGHAFEVDRDGEVVWQHVNFVADGGLVGLIGEAQRLPRQFDRAFFETRRAGGCGPEEKVATTGDEAS